MSARLSGGSMRALRSWLGLLGTLALAGLPAPAGAQPVGSEFQVNTYTTSRSASTRSAITLVAADASGNFVVVWRSAQDGDDYCGIFGQRYDSAGAPLGGPSSASTHTAAIERPVGRVRRERELRRGLDEPGRQTRDLRPALRQRGRRSGGEFRVNSTRPEATQRWQRTRMGTLWSCGRGRVAARSLANVTTMRARH